MPFPPFTEKRVFKAIEYGDLDALLSYIDEGAEIFPDAIIAAVRCDEPLFLQALLKLGLPKTLEATNQAVSSVTCLELLVADGYPIDASTLTEAIKCGRGSSVSAVLNLGVQVIESHLDLAIIGNQTKILDILLKHSIEKYPQLMLTAVQRGRHKCLKLLFDHKYVPTRALILDAINAGTPKCIKLLLHQNISIDHEVVEQFVLSDRLACLQVLLDEGLPSSLRRVAINIATTHNKQDCLHMLQTSHIL